MDIALLLARLERVREARLAPWEMAEAAVALEEAHGEAAAAEMLDISVQHLGNLQRCKTQLSPEAWERFVALGPKARLKAWIKIAAMTGRAQLRASAQEKRAHSVNPMGEVEPEDYQGLAPDSLR